MASVTPDNGTAPPTSSRLAPLGATPAWKVEPLSKLSEPPTEPLPPKLAPGQTVTLPAIMPLSASVPPCTMVSPV